MKVLFNNYSGSVSEKQEFVLSVGPLGGVYRIDYYMYSYRFQSKRLSEMVKNVLLVCYAISSVKVCPLPRPSSSLYQPCDFDLSKACVED